MFNTKHYFYLIKVQYLGYRFHGWQKQPKLKTIHLMIDRTLNYILQGAAFKTLGSGRTDAMVSAEEAAFQLFLNAPIVDLDAFLDLFNYNLPQDIRGLAIKKITDPKFNIIQSSKVKEYIYLFTHGQKQHPFCAPIMTTILDQLDIALMQEGAKLFEGTHNFKSYCYKATNHGVYQRTLLSCTLERNQMYKASFFPEHSYVLRVRGKGFMRNQIRIMMGILLELGRGNTDLEYIKHSLSTESKEKLSCIAPASGLILHKIDFE